MVDNELITKVRTRNVKSILSNVFTSSGGGGVVTATTTATLTVNSDTTYQSCLTAQAEALTIANPTGTPFNGQDLIIRVDSGSNYSITFGSQFRAIGTALPTTTTAGKVLYICSLWNAADSKWDTVNHLEV